MAKKSESKRIIEEELNILGKIVYEEARVTSRKSKDKFNKDGQVTHRGGTLRKSINYSVKSQRLTLSQIYYGQYQKPNELMVSIKKHIPESIKVITVNLVKNIIQNSRVDNK